MIRLLSFLILVFSFLIDGNTQTRNQSNQIDTAFLASTEWRHIGPFRGGRSCAVTGVPNKPNLFYFGATGGGVWKSEDGGRSWGNISDGYFGGSVGSIAVSESDPNVIYVGGGEKTLRGNVSYGYGVWKSVDAGKTWESMGLDKSRHISRIRIHPKDHNIVYASVMGNIYAPHEQRGVYKSMDGGKNWKKVLFVNNEVGAVDLLIDPNNTRHMYATTWKVNRTPYSFSSGGEGSALWKSTDSGVTWKNISENEGLPKGIWGISGVAVSPANSNRVWALIENEKGGLYRSDDAGKTWKKINEERSLRQRAWYYTRIYADPVDQDQVFVVNVAYHHSKDGGKTFKSKYAPHGDHHDLWIAPENPNRMIIGDDGGAQVSYDKGSTWSTYHNQPTAQFYRVTTDNHFPYRIYAAQQDNSTIRIQHRSNGRSINEDHWESTAGGESAHIAIDPSDNEIVYGGSYGGFLTRKDHRLGTTRAINVWPDNPMGYGAEGMKYRFQWNFPIFFSRHNPKKLYACSNQLHLTENEGQSWQIVSPDLTRNDTTKLVSSGGPITKDNTGVEYYCTIFAADESPIEEGLIWIGSDDGLVHITKDAGQNWTNVTPHGMPEWTQINCIEPDPFDAGGCYIAATGYKNGDFAPYLYKTSNYGKTWKKITSGIANDHFTRAIRSDKSKQGVLYAGTESGIYISTNDGQNWQSLQLNLPIVPITDLAVKDNNLIAATQGRSLWMIDDLSVIHQFMGANKNADYLFSPLPSYRYNGRQNKNVKGAGVNHPSGVMTHFYLNDYDEKKDTIQLVYTEMYGDTIRSFSNHAKEKKSKLKVEKGANIYTWNMRYMDAEKFDGMILWWGSMNGPQAVPGDYKVHLSVNGKIQEQAFKVLADPRLDLTQEDYQGQYAFIKSVNDKVTEAHETIKTIRKAKKQLDEQLKKFKDNDEITDEIQGLDSLLTNVEKALYQTKNRSNQDPLNFPIQLTNKLAHLNSLTQIGNYPPTDQAIAVRDELVSKIDEQLRKYREAIDTKVPNLNRMIKLAEVDAIQID